MFYHMMQNFTDLGALEPEKLKATCIEWEKCLLRVRNETSSV